MFKVKGEVQVKGGTSSFLLLCAYMHRRVGDFLVIGFRIDCFVRAFIRHRCNLHCQATRQIMIPWKLCVLVSLLSKTTSDGRVLTICVAFFSCRYPFRNSEDI
ncbi:unnamed protein product [Choristocarpus tenellus]